MAKYGGHTLHGYDFNYTGLKTCGLVTLSGFNGYNLSTGDDQTLLEEIYNQCYGSSGNIVFSISSAQFKTPSGFLKFLVNHPNTRVMHAYKNDAHPPSCVYLLIHHKNLPKGFVNNVKEYLDKMYMAPDGNWYVEKPECT